MYAIYDQTLKLKNLVDHYDRMNREKTIEKIKEFLNARETQLALLTGKCNDEDKIWSEKITALNQEINVALENIKQDIVTDMHHLNKTKKVIKKYRNPYQGPTKDGMFLDKKE